MEKGHDLDVVVVAVAAVELLEPGGSVRSRVQQVHGMDLAPVEQRLDQLEQEVVATAPDDARPLDWVKRRRPLLEQRPLLGLEGAGQEARRELAQAERARRRPGRHALQVKVHSPTGPGHSPDCRLGVGRARRHLPGQEPANVARVQARGLARVPRGPPKELEHRASGSGPLAVAREVVDKGLQDCGGVGQAREVAGQGLELVVVELPRLVRVNVLEGDQRLDEAQPRVGEAGLGRTNHAEEVVDPWMRGHGHNNGRDVACQRRDGGDGQDQVL